MCRSARVCEHVTDVWRTVLSVLCLKGLRGVCVFVVLVCVCVHTYLCMSFPW